MESSVGLVPCPEGTPTRQSTSSLPRDVITVVVLPRVHANLGAY